MSPNFILARVVLPPRNHDALPEISAPVMVAFADEKGPEQKRILAVTYQHFPVELEPGEQVVPIANGSERTVKVGVVSNLTGRIEWQFAVGSSRRLACRAESNSRGIARSRRKKAL